MCCVGCGFGAARAVVDEGWGAAGALLDVGSGAARAELGGPEFVRSPKLWSRMQSRPELKKVQN